MSNYYTALVSNEGLGSVRSDFKILIKADNLHKARAGVAARILVVERATDQEIFEAGRSGCNLLNLVDADVVDDGQQSLPLTEEELKAFRYGPGEPIDPDNGVISTANKLLGETKSGSAPGWLQDAAINAVAQNTGD